jgi:hydroxymethylbilane synthase
MTIRIATRKSALALWQAEHVAEQLRQMQLDVVLVPLSTRGDEILDRSLQKIGGKGLFIKELEVAMQNGEADIAVHSMKDVPVDMPDGFCIAAMLKRASPADALVTTDGSGFDSLAQGARVGSSSLRRQSQLKSMRPDLVIEPLRGNVNTRLEKLENEQFDAIVLASAGLTRLGLASRISQEFSPRQMLPAAAQGVVGIECLSNRAELVTTLAALNHTATRTTTLAERSVARELQADCQSPVASFAQIDGTNLHIEALVAAADGSEVIRGNKSGSSADAESLGADLARDLLQRGAARLMQAQ